MIYDMEDINADFKNTTVALVIGANDVVNPSAKSDSTSPLFGHANSRCHRFGQRNCYQARTRELDSRV